MSMLAREIAQFMEDVNIGNFTTGDPPAGVSLWVKHRTRLRSTL